MSQAAAKASGPPELILRVPPGRLIYVWQRPVRIFHWVTAVCIATLFLTGMYIAHPVFSMPGEAHETFLMARMRQFHNIAAFIFIIAYAARVYWFFAGNRYARSGFPAFWRGAWWRELLHETLDYITLGRHGAPRIGHNALAGLSYTLVPILLGLAQIITGLSMFAEDNPDGFWGRLTGWVTPLLGGSFRVVMWHYLFAWLFLSFVIAHVYIVLYDSIRDRNNLVESMITGYKIVRDEDGGHS